MENLPSSEIKMSLLEIARTFNVEGRTIRKYVSRLFPGLMKNGVATFLNESQVTSLKLEIEKNQHLERSFQLPKTDLEKKLLIQQAMNFLIEEVDDLKQQVENKSIELAEAQPKIDFHDQVGDSNGLYSIGETAKLLNYGRNTFFEMLRKGHIFFKTEPYQRYIEYGFFKMRTCTKNGYVHTQAFCTPKGLIWMRKKFQDQK